MNQNVRWPDGAKFAFSIFDDTDNSTVKNCKPVYDYLVEKGVLTTKSVWVYPSRGSYSGGSLSDSDYLEWVESLDSAGVEIGLHNVGDGRFPREEILLGLEEFKDKLNYFPKVHCNHVSNPDNLYWWDKRFVWPISVLYKIAYFIKRRKPTPAGGDEKTSEFFWGDAAKRKIKYVRNLTFSEINTLSRDPEMPWHDPSKPYVNYWFSSSDGHNVTVFNDLLSPDNLDKLEAEGGACIVYTHFASGFVDESGNLDEAFKARIDDLASRNGWFVPCSQLLDYLLEIEGKSKVSYWYRFTRNLAWGLERLNKVIKYRM
ncbi:hypothetical protein [Billgrantia gudaonensis]|uniref:Polysaccharide deacetylase n=1 Tax=Billgrantia gudaonensis TaxID=376427 RepID=A0A1G8QY49_9GAMM|nr:hypothetical protein [Halomonas gudaonensis]SDJ09664.1 hypothetical protein SAMN04487954_10329 [Halomonas gudaonensis]